MTLAIEPNDLRAAITKMADQQAMKAKREAKRKQDKTELDL